MNFAEHFVVIKILTLPILGLHFIRHIILVNDKRHGRKHFSHLTMQFKSAATEMSAKPQIVLADTTLTIPSRTTHTITAFVDQPSEWNSTGTVTPLDKYTSTASLFIPHSMSTIFGKNKAVGVTNTKESPYLIKKNTQIGEFSLVTPEQSKFIKPLDMAILSLVLEGDLDPPAYLNEHLRRNKPDWQNNTFWFPTLKTPAKTRGHTPIQTQSLTEKPELKEKGQLSLR